MKFLQIAVLTTGLFLASQSAVLAYGGPACTYSADTKDVKLVWTAFKFSDKTAVKGRFNQATVAGTPSAKSLAALMQNLSMDIDGASVETDNPARNATIQQFFFAKFSPPSKIHAAVARVSGDDTKGAMTVKITMNGVTRAVPFAYTATADGGFEAKASIDMLQFNLKAAHDSLHQACEDKHKGPDGVSKTWTQVDLLLTGKFKKACS